MTQKFIYSSAGGKSEVMKLKFMDMINKRKSIHIKVRISHKGIHSCRDADSACASCNRDVRLRCHV